ncbi:hypothetical protein [Methylorubrum thiocyanatum]
MRSLTAAQLRFLRFLAGNGDPCSCSITGATFDRLMHHGFIGGSIAQPHITEKGRSALARAGTAREG